MISCFLCGSIKIKKNGFLTKVVMFKSGKKKVKVQAFRCENGHLFKNNGNLSVWSDSFIEYVVYIYLRCLSLNTTVDILRATYEEDLLTKRNILSFVEVVGSVLPTLDDIDRLYTPKRSGYLAFDGVWFPFGKEHIVLLVCFDPETFDTIDAIWRKDEDYEGYSILIRNVLLKLKNQKINGVYGDGDNSLILALKRYLPITPFQLCVVHKSLRMQQTIPLKNAIKNKYISRETKEELLQFAKLFKNTLYAETKEESLKNLVTLLHWTTNHPREKFQKAVNSLKRNFKYTLTHFDYPNMQRDNNLIECFNGCIKPRLSLMRGFKKKENLNIYLKLFLLEFRFHKLKESRFKDRRKLSPLELGEVYLPKYYNFLTLLRTTLHLSFQPTRPKN